MACYRALPRELRHWAADCYSNELKEQETAVTESCGGAGCGRHGAVSDQSVHPHGLQHQDHSEYRRSGVRLRLAIAGHRTLGKCN